MSRLAFVVAIISNLRLAVANPAAELKTKGEDLARDGRYSEAIEVFKAADKLEPHASHACLIGLAYTRRELWPQAEVFMDQCHHRASAADPLPDWVAAADTQIKQRLATANVAAVELHTTPTEAGVALSVSDFLPDETFAPRTIHLPPGRHVVTAVATGYHSARIDVDIADRSPKRVEITLVPMTIAVSPSRIVPYAVLGAGVALLATGAVLTKWSYLPARDALARAYDGREYDQRYAAFSTRRTWTYGAYGLGALAVVTGVVLRMTKYADHIELTSEPQPGGAVVGVAWRR